ncbi:hypothetical protein K432DRAFT_434748 [Lepidopterella palustris CBS 459.81]|uniref:Nuclear pore complex subunit Nup192 n=1 Tax=Lepidopterella palustris CBS 459.81 TaxID=1314670 RepID=A0A8E2EAJ3_9PEZI|nr:hypothetical protein K432DRAFT_434748 [Lepidopterella palustris CBS 459.81]
MAEEENLGGLEGLHRDLVALEENRLPVVQRLWAQLEASIDEFKALLDKPQKNDTSRQALSSGKITIDGDEYAINDDFKQQTIQLADALDLDELQSAELLYTAQQCDSHDLDRPPFISAIIRFHKRRRFLLECFRRLIKLSFQTEENDQDNGSTAEGYLRRILDIAGADNANASIYWNKCLASMVDIEKWLQQLAERLHSAYVLGQSPSPEFVETTSLQRDSLTKQHESLSTICSSMVKRGYANITNFTSLLSTAKSLDKHDVITVHYVPMLTSLIAYVGAEESNCTIQDARALHKHIISGKDGDPWSLRNFHAAVVVWWLAEYSGRYIDTFQDPALKDVDLDKEADERSKLFMEALNDGALHFMLSVSQDIRPNMWYDPVKAGLVSHLLHEAPALPPESIQPSDHFQLLVMEQLQSFIDAFITNMPDTLRKLKTEEDEQRKLLHSRFQRGPMEYELHLERFLIIIAYAFDGFSDAAQAFWSDTDGNLYGFLQWAAKRQPTPRVAAFCEMLRSLSSGLECADAAHKFLLEEGSSASGKIRRTSSLSYTHIFNELYEFARNIHEPKKNTQSALYPLPQNAADQIVEPESAMMLESYLRLLAHLCRQSSVAREWILHHDTFSAIGIFVWLCVDKVESRLRASAFSALAALLTVKNPQLATSVWDALDNWTVSGFVVGAKQGNIPNAVSRHDVWETLAAGYDESNAFIELLRALVGPYPDNAGLNDALPFPENLGSSYRMPGIENFVDFVVGKIFATKCSELQDPLQLHVMRWNCLSFIVSCLSSFNENLVIFANRSSIAVDSVIESSSLAAYVLLHPFARVMEWLFNDKVLNALFAAAHQDFGTVDNAASESPLVTSLMLSIEVMDLVMSLQSTYLDIVRPLVKSQSSPQRATVSNSVLASFEDAVLNNLQIVVDLGLYCGTGHQDLTIVSLKLLEKLSSSRKLIVSPTAGFGQRSSRSKIIGILEKDNESERIAKSLIGDMELDMRELEAGPEAPGFVIKSHILGFLNSCLSAVSNKPTIAHLLLGFTCQSSTVDVADTGLWASSESLFHAILKLAVFYPDVDGETFVSWRSTIRNGCTDILQKLWRSPLTSDIVMSELRINGFLFVQATKQIPVHMETLWDNKVVIDPELLLTDSAVAFRNFLHQRSAFYDYAARELRQTVQAGMPTLKARIQSTLLGMTIWPGGEQEQNLTIFDLFDFIELETDNRFPIEDPKVLVGVDVGICKKEVRGIELYDTSLVEQLIVLRCSELRKTGILTEKYDPQILRDAQGMLLACLGQNQYQEVMRVQEDVLRTWVQLATVTLESCDFEPGALTAFILQALQVILPKLEKSYLEDITTAVELAGLSGALLQKIDFDSTSFEKTKTGDFANDRLSQLFRAALVGIFCPVATTQLRETCYQTCYRYLRGISKDITKGSPLGHHTLRTVRNAGDRLIEVLCDDAYAGQGTCKVSALLLLDALVALAIRADSKYMMEAFIRLNFVGVLVDNIKHIPQDLRTASVSEIPLLLSYYDASLALLLRICQTRLGAAHVLNAGLFQSIRESQIFSADPDIGLEFENPNALKKYFNLMLSVLRVINSAVLACGPQNDQTVFQARQFLKENRQSMVSIFKRNVKIGGLQDIGADLSDLVDCFTLLVTATGFLEYETQVNTQKATPNTFS